MSAYTPFLTARLSAAPIRLDHFPELRRLLSDPRVMATLSADGRPLPEDEIARRLAAHVEHARQHGFGIWLFRTRDTGDFVGRAGLRRVDLEGIPEVELLYALVPQYWGRGLATEMSAALVARAFGPLALPGVVAWTLTSNTPSRRVMEKLGFRYDRNPTLAGLPHALYRLTAADWSRRSRQ